MFPDVDWRPLFWLAGIGLIVALSAAGFLAYHIVRAMLFYVGVL